MKTIIIAIITLSLASAFGQQKEVFFKTKKMKSGRLVFEPIGSSFSTKGKQQGMLFLNQKYFNEIICQLQKTALSAEQLEHLCSKKNKIILVFYFDMKGNILHAQFLIRKEAFDIIKEENLYKLYSLLKQTKLDTSRWGSIDPRYLDKDNKFDFAFLSGPLGAHYCDFCSEENK